jgi:hypothetical protein
MEGRSHTVIKVQLYQSIGESKNIIEIGHDAAAVFAHYTQFFPHTFIYSTFIFQFWGPAPQGATHFLLPVTAGPAPQGAIFSFTNLGRGQGAKPLDPNSNFTPGAFAHCNTYF